MKRCDNAINKITIFVISLLLTSIVVLLYFLDQSLGWGFEKICSCIIVSLWIFFIAPSLRNSYILNKDKSIEEWFRMGFEFGSSGIAFPILLAPYFGIKYYCEKKASD